MARRINAQVAQTQFPKLLDEAVRERERIIVERDGEPAVVILSIEDYLENTANAPAWLREAWEGSRKRGVDKLTMEEIDEEIAAYRREKRASAAR
ncbi:MAG TPA: type II toxin-antitoxin system Phd/YefM family antitoxin [Acidobacteriaceae bacterium]